MCGVAGILHFGRSDPVTSNILHKMNNAMLHRGPDGDGIYVSENKRIGLGHRRLSIIDLSEGASQPMSNGDGSVWISYNGEIYNHKKYGNYNNIDVSRLNNKYQFISNSNLEFYNVDNKEAFDKSAEWLSSNIPLANKDVYLYIH